MKTWFTVFCIIFYFSNIAGAVISHDMALFQTPLDNPTNGSEDNELPNTIATIAIAVLPGFFIHGLGHYYIRENDTGNILLGIEIFSIIGAVVFLDKWIGMEKCTSNYSRINSGIVVGPELSRSETCYGLFTPTLFIASWLYDVIAAPIKASKMRKECELKKKEKQLVPGLGFLPAKDFRGASLSLTWRF